VADSAEPGRETDLGVTLSELIDLLIQHRCRDKADWLAARLTVLADSESTEESLATARRDLHAIVLGMGGLTDLRLVDPASGEYDIDATARLDHLADRLYTLTRD